jgi:RNA recognition motif-containing protein
MSNRLYVGNLPYTITQNDLQQIFSEYGTVVSTQIISDRETGRSRGFGFVEMDSAEAFRSALQGANGRDVGGRQISVTEARERAPREGGGRPSGPPRSGGGWGGGERRGPPRPGGPPRSGSGGYGSDRGGGGGDDRGWRRDDGGGARRKGGGRDRFEKRREGGEDEGRPRRQRFDSFPEDEDFG